MGATVAPDSNASWVDSICSLGVTGTAGVSTFRGTAPVIATVMIAGVVIDCTQAVWTKWNDRMSRRAATSLSKVTSGVDDSGYSVLIGPAALSASYSRRG